MFTLDKTEDGRLLVHDDRGDGILTWEVRVDPNPHPGRIVVDPLDGSDPLLFDDRAGLAEMFGPEIADEIMRIRPAGETDGSGLLI
jgi:hypothetical protein